MSSKKRLEKLHRREIRAKREAKKLYEQRKKEQQENPSISNFAKAIEESIKKSSEDRSKERFLGEWQEEGGEENSH